jgi:hypothetical protein
LLSERPIEQLSQQCPARVSRLHIGIGYCRYEHEIEPASEAGLPRKTKEMCRVGTSLGQVVRMFALPLTECLISSRRASHFR